MGGFGFGYNYRFYRIVLIFSIFGNDFEEIKVYICFFELVEFLGNGE